MRNFLLIFMNILFNYVVLGVESYESNKRSNSPSNEIPESFSESIPSKKKNIPLKGNIIEQYEKAFKDEFLKANKTNVQGYDQDRALKNAFTAYEKGFEEHKQFLQEIYLSHYVSGEVWEQIKGALNKITHKDFKQLKKGLEENFYINNAMKNEARKSYDDLDDNLDVPFLMQLKRTLLIYQEVFLEITHYLIRLVILK